MTKPLLKQKLLKLAVYLANEESSPIAPQPWYPYVQRYTKPAVEGAFLATPVVKGMATAGVRDLARYQAMRAAGQKVVPSLLRTSFTTAGMPATEAASTVGRFAGPAVGALALGLEASKGFNQFDQLGGWAAPTEMAGRLGLSAAPMLAAAGPVGWAGLAGKEVLERAVINPTREALNQVDVADAGMRRIAVDTITQYAMMPPQLRINLVRNNPGYRRALINAHSELGGLGGVHTTMDPNLSAMDLARRYEIGKSNILRVYSRFPNSANVDPEMRRAIEAELSNSSAAAVKSPTFGYRTQNAVDWMKRHKTGIGVGLGAAAIGIPAFMMLYRGIQAKRRKRQEKTAAQGVGIPQGSNPWETRNPFTVTPSASKVPNDAKTMALPPTNVAGGPSNVMEAQMQVNLPNLPPTNMMPTQSPQYGQQGMTAMASANFLHKMAASGWPSRQWGPQHDIPIESRPDYQSIAPTPAEKAQIWDTARQQVKGFVANEIPKRLAAQDARARAYTQGLPEVKMLNRMAAGMHPVRNQALSGGRSAKTEKPIPITIKPQMSFAEWQKLKPQRQKEQADIIAKTRASAAAGGGVTYNRAPKPSQPPTAQAMAKALDRIPNLARAQAQWNKRYDATHPPRSAQSAANIRKGPSPNPNMRKISFDMSTGSPSLEAASYLKSISDDTPPSSQPKPEIRPKQVTQTDTTAVQSVKASPNI